MSQEYFEKMVSIDWKFVGRDYMGFFPDNYRELKFLFSQEWEDLCDEVANEMPENLFDQFSPFLAAYGYELWNLDDYSDSYNLCLVASKDAKSFYEFWSHQALDDDSSMFFNPERLGVEAAANVKPVKESQAVKSKEKKTLIADLDHHLEYGGIRDRQLLQRQVIEYQTDGETFYGVADLDLFPFETLDAEGFYKKWDQGFRYYPIYTRAPHNIWEEVPPEITSKKKKTIQNKRLVYIKDFNDFVCEPISGAEFPQDNYLYRAAFGNSLFLLDDKTLYRIVSNQLEKICDLDFSASNVLALNEDEVLLFYNNAEDSRILLVNSIDKRLQDISCGFEPRDAFVINPNEIGFIHTEKQQHPLANYIFEQTAFLCRFDIRSRTIRKAALEGLHHEYKWDLAIMKSQASNKITVKSFEGFITAEKGHADWLILNYISNQTGKHDLAWFWNTTTDEVLKIQEKDLPRIEPVISYVPAIDRYVADESCRTYLLVEFEEIEKREKFKLVWV
jgi:hypothetical protein